METQSESDTLAEVRLLTSCKGRWEHLLKERDSDEGKRGALGSALLSLDDGDGRTLV